jgi:hypothetical protein
MEDCVSLLNVWIQQKRLGVTPNYNLSDRLGESHNPFYESCTVSFGEYKFVANGKFTKIKDAKQAAAKEALRQLSVIQVQTPLEDEVDEVIFLGVKPGCYLFDADNVPIIDQQIQQLVSGRNEIHLFFSATKSFEFKKYEHLNLHPTKPLVPEMTDHCISWWVCEQRHRLVKEKTKVYIISRDKGMQAIVALGRESGVDIDQKVQL